MFRFILLIAISVMAFGAWRLYEKQRALQSINSYSDAVKNATNNAFGKLDLPSGIQDEDKANAAGQLMGCLNMCLTKGEKLSFIVAPQNCEPLCLCLVNGTMKAMPWDQFLGKNQTIENRDKGVQLFRSCLARYKNN